MKNVLLTGATGGMGLATVKKLANEGYYVFALDKNAPKEEIQNVTFFQVDIRDSKALEKVHAQLKDIKLDAIINMAGIYDLNSLVEIPEEDFIKIFDINLFGTYRINKMFLDLLIEKSKIIITSSELASLNPLPFTGLYGITKAAVEKYADSLRMELQLLSHQVIVIRPGAVDTQIIDISQQRINRFAEETKLYKENANKFKGITESIESKKISPEKVANLVTKILKKKKTKYVYKINRNKLLLLLNILPKKMQYRIIRKILIRKGSH